MALPWYSLRRNSFLNCANTPPMSGLASSWQQWQVHPARPRVSPIYSRSVTTRWMLISWGQLSRSNGRNSRIGSRLCPWEEAYSTQSSDASVMWLPWPSSSSLLSTFRKSIGTQEDSSTAQCSPTRQSLVMNKHCLCSKIFPLTTRMRCLKDWAPLTCRTIGWFCLHVRSLAAPYPSFK